MLRIRDVYLGSQIRMFPIPDTNFIHPGSASKEFKFFDPKKWFLGSRKYGPGCSSRIRIRTIPDPGDKKAPDPGSGSAKLKVRIRNTSWTWSWGMGSSLSSSLSLLAITSASLSLSVCRVGERWWKPGKQEVFFYRNLRWNSRTAF